MSAASIIFYIIAAFILGTGILAVTTRKIFRASIWLLFSLIGIASLYFWMQLEFLAAVQIIVYVLGKRSILICSDHSENFFHTSKYRALQYKLDGTSNVVFFNKLSKLIEEIVSNPNKTDNPISDILGRFITIDSPSSSESIKKFREERIAKISVDETPVPFMGAYKIVMHLIPFNSLVSQEDYDIKTISSNFGKLPPISCRGWNGKFNFDGFITYAGFETGKSYSYTHLYKNGIIEAVNGSMFSAGKVISNPGFEEVMIYSLDLYLKIMMELKINLPIDVFLALLNVKDFTMFTAWSNPFGDSSPIDRDNLLLPGVVIENYEMKADKILKPCFDALWNACGFSKSPNYDENGSWRSHFVK